jgi:hypothetical protein
MEFSNGDVLVCVDPMGTLQKDRVYTSEGMFDGYVRISETGGTYFPHRFKRLVEGSPFQEWESKNIKGGAA